MSPSAKVHGFRRSESLIKCDTLTYRFESLTPHAFTESPCVKAGIALQHTILHHSGSERVKKLCCSIPSCKLR